MNKIVSQEASTQKAVALAAIDAALPTLIEASENIHDNVEYFFKEFKAQRWLCDVLKGAGFEVEEGLGSLKTAFRGRIKSKKPGPTIAFLSEFDGMEPYGHSCGHNVGGPASIGAAIGLASVIDEIGGEVISLGTPGEEGGGGKNILHREGFFEGIDAMMLIYPGKDNIAHSRAVVGTGVNFEYFGQAAHGAARPEWGINALDAMMLAFNGIAYLRQQIPSDVRIHYMITKGGERANVIPDHTSARLTVRANLNATLDNVIPRIDACIVGAQTMTGTWLERKWREGPRNRPLLSNYTMAMAADRNMNALGMTTRPRDELSGAWGGDTSNVSWFVPTIQPQIAMTDVPPHSHQFHDAAKGPAAQAALENAAKTLAMTGIDLVMDKELLAAVKAEFAAESAIPR